jgi:hypothetical protein
MGASSRTLIVGDVHGCIEELNALLAEASFRAGEDRLIFIGDLIGKGPHSRAVYERARELKADAILGNHEWRLLESVEGGKPAGKAVRRLREEFGDGFDALIEDLKQWPFWIDSDAFLAVHGGLIPGRGPAISRPVDLVNIRTWDGTGDDLQDPKNPPWFEFYHDVRPVVFGHWAVLGGVVRENVIGLDTGCVYGGELSLVIFPGRKIVSVPAKKAYCTIKVQDSRG